MKLLKKARNQKILSKEKQRIVMKITHSETEIIKERLELLEEEYKLNNHVEMLVLTKKLLNFITETKN